MKKEDIMMQVINGLIVFVVIVLSFIAVLTGVMFSTILVGSMIYSMVIYVLVGFVWLLLGVKTLPNIWKNAIPTKPGRILVWVIYIGLLALIFIPLQYMVQAFWFSSDNLPDGGPVNLASGTVFAALALILSWNKLQILYKKQD